MVTDGNEASEPRYRALVLYLVVGLLVKVDLLMETVAETAIESVVNLAMVAAAVVAVAGAIVTETTTGADTAVLTRHTMYHQARVRASTRAKTFPQRGKTRTNYRLINDHGLAAIFRVQSALTRRRYYAQSHARRRQTPISSPNTCARAPTQRHH